ncbi:MAG: hypothetical protein EBX33_03755 [Synechococcaceae bacterium WB8_1A_041]|nr:hypothetical protein [Synechococcaceae bacterium WB7_1B_046]NCY13788.1 hypothetical protein [Synechococcaceae bacterium WB8_1A_041]NDA74612.1 hypothetical protein [Synechococcaceae bacterium WB8_3_299]NDG78715.1 hypothetical protein [Synechococcaceae bacterium WB8_1B_057]
MIRPELIYSNRFGLSEYPGSDLQRNPPKKMLKQSSSQLGQAFSAALVVAGQVAEWPKTNQINNKSFFY